MAMYTSCIYPPSPSSLPFNNRLGLSLNPPAFWPWETVKVGPLTVSPMGVGTWAWGNKLLWNYEESMDEELQMVFNKAVKIGINLFDTADSYGTGKLNGRSELLLGKFMQQYPGSEKVRKSICIATKFAAYPWRITPRQLVLACKASLKRLELDQIAIGQLHWSTANYAPLQEKALWDGLIAMYSEDCSSGACERNWSSYSLIHTKIRNRLKTTQLEKLVYCRANLRLLRKLKTLAGPMQGLVKAVGVSNYGPKQLLRIYEYMDARGVPVSSAQIQLSLLSKGTDQMKVKSLCDELGIKVIAYSPLALGLLTGKYSTSNLPKGPRGLLFRQILPGLDPLLQSLKMIARRQNKSPSQVAINWCICNGMIPIPGVKSLTQAEENFGALGWRLTSDEITKLEMAADQVPRGMLQNIFQTK